MEKQIREREQRYRRRALIQYQDRQGEIRK